MERTVWGMMEVPEIQANFRPSVGLCILGFHKGSQGMLLYPLLSTWRKGFLLCSHNPLQYEVHAILQAASDDVAPSLPPDGSGAVKEHFTNDRTVRVPLQGSKYVIRFHSLRKGRHIPQNSIPCVKHLSSVGVDPVSVTFRVAEVLVESVVALSFFLVEGFAPIGLNFLIFRY